MRESECMKRILLLGGLRYLLPVIKAAHELGYYTITCDYLPDNVAHKFSDEYYNASIIDKEAVLKISEKSNIDGIMSFACDPGVTTAAYVAEKLGLPHSGSYESICILQNKRRFRKFLTDNGFNVPMAKGYRNIGEARKDIDLYHWPIIVKPADSAGSKGVTRVNNPEKLEDSIKYALSFSHNNEYIIEDFLEIKGQASDTDSFSVNGELKFVSFSSQYFDEKCENPYTPAAYSWPSTIAEKYQKELTIEIQRLLELLDMKTSIYNIETRVCVDGKAYIMECSPRGGGNRLAEMLKYATGVDLIKASVLAAVGEPVDIKQQPYDGYWAEIILHSRQKGRFQELCISEDIKDKIVECKLWVRIGEYIGGFTAANEAIGSIVLKFNAREEAKKILANIDAYFQVKIKR